MDLERMKEVASGLLTSAMIDIMLPESSKIAESAHNWLLDIPSDSEIADPPIYSFISCCNLLGLNWRELQSIIADAVSLNDSKLVQASELCYNKAYEADSNGHRTSKTQEGEC